ncbi:MAG: hypothetical protein N3D85_02230 [Candidatus Bathyarchaeota archaeon]|nr:hypothetical protein [Candidatus Bathyarchaeota archaeon]
MTKPAPTVEDALLKCHVTVTEAGQVSPVVSEVVPNDALDLCGEHLNIVVSDSKGKLKVTVAETKLDGVSELEKTLSKLYDLEVPSPSEKPSHIDLGVDLYQMEEY